MTQGFQAFEFETALSDTTRVLPSQPVKDGDTVVIALKRSQTILKDENELRQYRDDKLAVRDVRRSTTQDGTPVYEIVCTAIVAGVAAVFLPLPIVVGALLAWLSGRLLFAVVKEVRLITQATPDAANSIRGAITSPAGTVAGIGGGVLMLALAGLVLWKGV